MRATILMPALLALAAVFTAGCGPSTPTPPLETTQTSAGDHATRVPDGIGARHDNSAWWCSEHGVPEEICGLCDAKVAADLQKKGDWCREHDRPDSQCFVCHPERQAHFAAQYEARYGKQPPEPDL